MKKQHAYAILSLCFGIISLSSCDKNSDSTTPATPKSPSVLYVSNAEVTAGAKNLQLLSPADSTVLTPSVELANGASDGNGVVFSPEKNLLFQVSRAQKSIRVYSNASSILAASLPVSVITDASLSSGRELAYDATNDILYVANNTDSTLRVYDKASTLNGNVTGKKLKLTGEPWGIHFDKDNNRLMVLIDKSAMRIEFFNNPSSLAAGTVTPTLKFFINGSQTNGVTARLHGITYSKKRDILLVTEIGNATGTNFATDGGIYIIEEVAKISNNSSVLATRTIFGSNTGLGNPVDIAFDDRDNKGLIYVAEKANKKIQVFKLSDNGNVAPTRSYISTLSPEAIHLNAQ
jgi:uncharacterized protein YjiK